jgi:mannose-6-phosphate isomerase-like protein (cupin superfamily)
MDVLYQLSYLGDVRKHNIRPCTLYTYRMEGLTHYEKEERPWGNFERFTLNEKTTVKIITVNAGEAFSLQTHDHRDEFWRVIQGFGVIRIGDSDYEAHEGDMFFCPRHSKHRVTGGPGGTTFLEIAFGDFDENDITRLEDRYGRV